MTKTIIEVIQEILKPGPVTKGKATLTPFIIEYEGRSKHFIISRKSTNIITLTGKYKYPDPGTGFKRDYERVLPMESNRDLLIRSIETFPDLNEDFKNKLLGEVNEESVGWLANILVKSNPKICEELNDVRSKGLHLLLNYIKDDFIDINYMDDTQSDFDSEMREFLVYLNNSMSYKDTLNLIISEIPAEKYSLSLSISKGGVAVTENCKGRGTQYIGSFTGALNYLNRMTISYKYLKEKPFSYLLKDIKENLKSQREEMKNNLEDQDMLEKVNDLITKYGLLLKNDEAKEKINS